MQPDLISTCHRRHFGLPSQNSLASNLIAISKIVDHVQGQGKSRFKSGAYTLVFEHFESVFNTALGR